MERGEDFPSATIKAVRETAEQLPIVGGGIRYGSHPFGAVVSLGQDIIEKIGGKPWAKPWLDIGGRALGVPGTTQYGKIKRGRKRDDTLWEHIVGKVNYQRMMKGGAKRPTLGGTKKKATWPSL